MACSAKIRNIKVKAKPQEIFFSCGFAFLKRIDYKGITAFIAVVLFLFGKIYQCVSFDIIFYIQEERRLYYACRIDICM